MNVLSFNIAPSIVSSINQKVTNFLTQQQKRVAIIALAVLSLIAFAIYYFRNSFIKGSVKAIPASDLKLAHSKLEEGFNISEATLSKIQDLMPKIQAGEKDDAIEWFSTGIILVFKIAGSPDFVFKMARGGWVKATDLMDEHFAAMVKAKAVCLIHELGLLVIPHTKKIKIDGHTLIAEECLDIATENSVQEEFYHKFSTELNEAVRQLAIFIAKTGFNDVIWPNIPLINESEGFHGNRRIGLRDIKRMKSALEGFVGSENGSFGLIRCVSEEQIDLVIAEARKEGVRITDEQIKKAKNFRLEELESDKKLREFHEKHQIIHGKEHLQVNVDTLGLDLTEEDVENNNDDREQTFTLRKVTEDVVAKINELLDKASDQASIKGKRSILFTTNSRPIRFYECLGATGLWNEEREKKLWLNRIFQALVDQGHLFKFENTNNGYQIQA